MAKTSITSEVSQAIDIKHWGVFGAKERATYKIDDPRDSITQPLLVLSHQIRGIGIGNNA
ncbi:hypothetical protein [Photobacterium indicum]|uniref:Uncharacterized protein n=1 Tax=Photobacterium indicum TaxID=81447 RepID=A0A2T3LF76_9GAMM|nr:hypothetical protein [Photobacterium indicum]PSV50016.1 hypothetical protein C9J47_05560 [Photobacterium indicum]